MFNIAVLVSLWLALLVSTVWMLRKSWSNSVDKQAKTLIRETEEWLAARAR